MTRRAGTSIGVDVRDFGTLHGTGTGEPTVDDSAVFQAAINSLDPNRGGRINVPQGKYLLGTGLVCPTTQGLELVGEGQTGVSDNLVSGSTRFRVANGQVGLTLGTSGATEFRGHRLSNIHFYEQNVGQAVGGIHMINVCDSTFDRVACGGFTAGYGIFSDAVGSFGQYNTYIDCRVGRCLYGYRQIAGIGARWLGGQADGSQNGVLSPIVGSIGFWIESGDSFMALGTLAAGFETLWDLGPQIGHHLNGIRCEVWSGKAVRVRPGARRCKISGTGDNSLIGRLGVGVSIEATSGHLVAGINSVVTSFTLDSGPEAATFPTSGLITIDAERIAVGSRSGTVFSGCLRGLDGTSGANHSTGATVSAVAEDTEDYMTIENVAGLANRHVDNGLRTRFPSLGGSSAQASVITGTLIGKAAHYNTQGAFDGWTPLYSAISGIALAAHVRGATNNTTGVSSITLTLTGSVPVGDLLVLGGGYGLASTVTVTAADTKGNTYTVDRHDDLATGGTPHSFVVSAPVTAGLVAADVITVSFSSAVNYPIVYAYDYTGVKASGYVDVVGGATGASTTPSTGALTTTADYDLMFVALCRNPTTLTAGTGVAVLDENSTTGKSVSLLSVAATTAGAYAAAGTLATSSDWAISAVAYKKA